MALLTSFVHCVIVVDVAVPSIAWMEWADKKNEKEKKRRQQQQQQITKIDERAITLSDVFYHENSKIALHVRRTYTHFSLYSARFDLPNDLF